MDLTKMVCFPERRIFISPDHNWVFYAWEVARSRGWIDPMATLVHVDAHLDDLHDGVEVVGFYDIHSLEDAYFVAEEMGIASFIWPGFIRGTIDTILFVERHPEDADPFEPRRLSTLARMLVCAFLTHRNHRRNEIYRHDRIMNRSGGDSPDVQTTLTDCT